MVETCRRGNPVLERAPARPRDQEALAMRTSSSRWGANKWHSFLGPETFRAMYPRLDEWLPLKGKYDANGTITSDPARRVGLVRS